MVIAQVYASFNRRHMMEIVCEVLGVTKNGDTIESIHNYIDFKDFVIRKGAIRSYAGEKILIPFNMRDGILLCEGKSNVEWNCTSPHGAGRIMSRAKAKELLSLEHYERQMKGIYSSSINKGTLDESPSSYKDSAMIEAAIEPTATVLDKIVPILNIKAKNSGPSFKERKEEKKRNNERQAARELKQKNR